MTDYHCQHCKSGRFIGQGYGTGQVRLQCKACGRWQWVRLDGGTEKQAAVAKPTSIT